MAKIGKQVVGYISEVSVKTVKDGLMYIFMVVTSLGEELTFRVRQPADWMFVGFPVSGIVVKVNDHYQFQDVNRSLELQPSRPVEVESLEITYVKLGDQRQAIITGRSSNTLISAPPLSQSIVKKSEKLQHEKSVLHIASLPSGNKVVAVQSIKEFKRDITMKRLLNMVGKMSYNE